MVPQKGFIFLKHNKKCENKNFEQAKKSLHKFKVKQATSSSIDKSVKLDASYLTENEDVLPAAGFIHQLKKLIIMKI